MYVVTTTQDHILVPTGPNYTKSDGLDHHTDKVPITSWLTPWAENYLETLSLIFKEW